MHLGSLLVADTKAAGHGFHDVYAQPQALQVYRQTGKFPDGTVLVGEGSAQGEIRNNDHGCSAVGGRHQHMVRDGQGHPGPF